MKTRKEVNSFILLLITTLIWGSAFVFQDIAANYVGSYTFNCLRFFIAFICMLPFAIYKQNKLKKENKNNSLKEIIISSSICGFFLIGASILQQFGVGLVGAGKSGFITSMYLVIIPVLLFIFAHKRYSWNVYLGIVISVIGLYLLSVKGNFTLETGDILLIGSAFMFAFQIISTGYFAKNMDPITLSCGQSLVSFILSLIPTLIFDKPTMSSIGNAIWPILYVAIFSTCIAYTLQIVGQRHLNETLASLVMSFESVFSALFGALFLQQYLSLREYIGCIVIFIGVILAEITFKKKEKVVPNETSISEEQKITE